MFGQISISRRDEACQRVGAQQRNVAVVNHVAPPHTSPELGEIW
jgi:hypothetical protein